MRLLFNMNQNPGKTRQPLRYFRVFSTIAILLILSLASIASDDPPLQRLSGWFDSTLPQQIRNKSDLIPMIVDVGAKDLNLAVEAANARHELMQQALGPKHYLVKSLKTHVKIFEAYTRLPQKDQELIRNAYQAFKESIQLSKAGKLSLAIDELTPAAQLVNDRFGPTSHIFATLQFQIAHYAHDLGSIPLARESSQLYASAIEALYGDPSSPLRDACLFQAVIESADGQFKKSRVLLKRAQSISRRLVPVETPDTKNLAVATVLCLREDRIDDALTSAAIHRQEFRENGDVRYIKDVTSDYLNDLAWVTNTLSTSAYFPEALVVTNFAIRRIETSEAIVQSDNPLASFYDVKSKLLEQMGRFSESKKCRLKSQSLLGDRSKD